MFVKIANADSCSVVIVNLAHVIAIETVRPTASRYAQIVFRCTTGIYNVFVLDVDLDEWLSDMAALLSSASFATMPDRVLDLTAIRSLIENRRKIGGAHALLA